VQVASKGHKENNVRRKTQGQTGQAPIGDLAHEMSSTGINENEIERKKVSEKAIRGGANRPI